MTLKIMLDMGMEKTEVNEAAACADLLPTPLSGLPGWGEPAACGELRLPGWAPACGHMSTIHWGSSLSMNPSCRAVAG